MTPTLSRLDRHDISVQLLKPRVSSDMRILDCGSRDGRLLRELGQLTGTPSLVALDWHNRSEGGVTFVAHNLEHRLPFQDNEFDVVVCNDVLEHVENKNALFAELLRVSRRYVLVSLPNTQYWRYIWGLIRGKMSSKYNFLVQDGADRHRWITYYRQNMRFISDRADGERRRDYEIVDMIDSVPDRNVPSLICRRYRQFFVFNQLFLLQVREPRSTDARG